MDKSYAHNNEKLRNLVMKLPKDLLFKNIGDKEKVILYLNYLKKNHSRDVAEFDNDNLVRGLIIRQLRLTNMKILDINLLLIMGLNKINENVLFLPQRTLVLQLIKENQDENDIDIVNRIIAQIRTKLPIDLSERMNFEHTNVVKQAILNNFEKRIERFQGITEFDFNDIDTPEELSLFHRELQDYRSGTGLYDTTDNNYDYMYDSNNSSNNNNNNNNNNYYSSINNITNRDTDTVGVVDENGEMFFLEMKKGSYNNQNEMHIDNLRKMKEEQEKVETTHLNHVNVEDIEKDVKAEYVDRKPVLMVNPKTEKKYYYDEHSRTIKLLPKDSTMKAISLDEVEKLLKSYNVSEEEINKTLVYLRSDKIGPDDEDFLLGSEKSKTEKKESSGDNLIRNIIIGLVVLILIGLLVNLALDYKAQFNF